MNYKFQNKYKMYKNIPAIIFILLISNACTNQNTTAESNTKNVNENTLSLTEAQYKNAKIETVTLQEKTITEVLKLNGKIDVPPQNLVFVSAPLGGYLISTKLLPGMQVKKGEIIACMEDQQYIQLQQDYLVAKSKLNLAELDYIRQKELNETQASSDKIMQQAKAEATIQKITMNAIGEKLKLITINPLTISANTISKSINIYSSISGYVSKVNVNIGKYVAPTDVMFELINPTDIHLNLKVFDKDISKLSIGQKIIAFDNAYPDKKFNCEIILISKDVTSEGTVDVHCHFQTYDNSLLPGMYMNAVLSIDGKNSNCLPEESVVSYDGKEYIFIETANMKYEITEVTTGLKQDGFITIINSESIKNKLVVSKGAYTLLMKLKNKSE